jgi:hypothetical protein
MLDGSKACGMKQFSGRICISKSTNAVEMTCINHVVVESHSRERGPVLPVLKNSLQYENQQTQTKRLKLTPGNSKRSCGKFFGRIKTLSSLFARLDFFQ